MYGTLARGNECMQCLQTAWLFNESAFSCIALLNLPKRREVYFKQEQNETFKSITREFAPASCQQVQTNSNSALEL